MRYHFGEAELDCTSYALIVSGKMQQVEPRVFDLIRYFAEHSGDIVTRDDLIESVWAGRIVADTTVAGSVKSARKVLGDDGNTQKYIETIRGRGFRLSLPVVKTDGAVPTKDPTPTLVATERLPSIVILPFLVFGDESALAPLADGVVENLTTVLTRVPLLRIISRTSSFAYRGRSYTTEDVRQDLNVDFLVEGSVQQTASGVRLNVQLIECADGFHTWAQRFDSKAGDAALDDLLERITASLEPQIVRCITDQLRNDSSTPGAKSLLLQAMGQLTLRGWHHESFESSLVLLDRAISLEPELALAHAYRALILGLGHRVGLLDRSNEIVKKSLSSAETAIALDDMDSTVMSLAGCALADVGQPERAIPLIERAIELNSANGHAWAALGSAQALLGNFKPACKNLKHGISISPADGRRAVWCAVLAIAQLLSGSPELAAETAEEGCRHDERNYIPRIALAGARMVEEKVSQAEASLLQCLRIKPDLSQREITSLLGERLGKALDALRSNLEQSTV